MFRDSRIEMLFLLVILLTPSLFIGSITIQPTESHESFYTAQTTSRLFGWIYRKSHTLEGVAAAGMDYQIRITVYRSIGTDYGENVFVGTKCRVDFGDIRFTDDDGMTLLDYWLEGYDNDIATFWVEVMDSLNTTQSIFIYYGNSTAESISNGTATFPLFDDFNRPDSDTVGGGWFDDNGDGDNNIENNLLKTVQNESQYCHIEQTAPPLSNFVLHGKLKQHANAPDNWRMAIGAYWSSDKWMKIGWRSTSDTIRADLMAHPEGGAVAAVPLVDLDDTWCYYKIEVKSITIDFYYSLDSTTWVPVYSAQRYPGVSGIPALIIIGKGYENNHSSPKYPNLDWDNNYTIAGPIYTNFADDVFVRKFVENEPTHISWGAEEILEEIPTSTSPTNLPTTTPTQGVDPLIFAIVVTILGGTNVVLVVIVVILFRKLKT